MSELTKAFAEIAGHPLAQLNRTLDAAPRFTPAVVPGPAIGQVSATVNALVDRQLEPWRRVFASLPKLFPKPR